jgi:DNA (cytosine-5)-methyltransferase 1
MIPRVYYNEIDPQAAEWLRQLTLFDHIPHGHVDQRCVSEVTPDAVRSCNQCHFFAGIGGWAYAAKLAGYRGPLWTASLPCQPFSQAGKQRGTADKRHLWPVFHKLVAECLPPAIVGEQVASKAGREWLAAVRADLEKLGYVVGAADLCAAGVGAPHIRQRLYWGAVRVADSSSKGLEGRAQQSSWDEQPTAERGGDAGGVADAIGKRRDRQHTLLRESLGDRRPADLSKTPWCRCDYLPCRDGKARPVEPGLEPLAYGISGRVGLLRGYGNAIVPQVAAIFLISFLESVELLPLTG